MKSRKEVGEILASGDIPVTELRASLIIGAQGGSYATVCWGGQQASSLSSKHN